jgi:hypothetical protein
LLLLVGGRFLGLVWIAEGVIASGPGVPRLVPAHFGQDGGGEPVLSGSLTVVVVGEMMMGGVVGRHTCLPSLLVPPVSEVEAARAVPPTRT